MVVRSIRKAWRVVLFPVMIGLLSVVVACGGTTTEPAAAPAATAVPAATAQAVATAAPEPTAMPSMADADSYLHLAVTPLPQTPTCPGWPPAAGHLVFRPMWRT